MNDERGCLKQTQQGMELMLRIYHTNKKTLAKTHFNDDLVMRQKTRKHSLL